MRDSLVLNKSFCAVHVTDWQRTMTLLYQGAAQAVDENLQCYSFEDWSELSKLMTEHPHGFVGTSSARIALPEVIRLVTYDSLPKTSVKFTRHNLYEHYDNTCCYCGVRKNTKELNLDHVLPRSKGGRTDWSNIVLSCLFCNTTKDDKPLGIARYPRDASKMPEQLKHLAGRAMSLKVQPSKPRWNGPQVVTSKIIPVSWQRLLDAKYWATELEQ